MKKVYVIGIFYVLLVFVLSALSISLLAAAQEGALDGKTFVGEMGESGKDKGDKDELVFKDGKFSSAACEKYGFGDAPYTATVSGGHDDVRSRNGERERGKNEMVGHGHWRQTRWDRDVVQGRPGACRILVQNAVEEVSVS